MGDMMVVFECATAFRLCAAHAVHVRHPTIPSERARASSVGKTPSFSFRQVDMYGCYNLHLNVCNCYRNVLNDQY